MNKSVAQSLDEFVQRLIKTYAAPGSVLQTEWDENWPSPCEQGQPDERGLIRWQPVKREHPGDFSVTEQALEMTFHEDVKSFYGRYWSEGLDASTPRGALQLIQPWNEEDFERLLQNLVGHVLMKRRLKQPETLFIAVTDDDDFIISVDNATGNVMLEQVGLEPTEVLAQSLSEFIDQIEPAMPSH
ncbi:SecY-interacting protein [Lacimicrobium sp. SS2-24]|uniref:SecY-interacting protein n=1 Tax=Lacimicrobium sp. SS2-24 TaxID=2005569 RepID=UPI000B4AB32A|nr:SecY-interacting protein [Lacimicrobium sp. SS2-24]